MPWYLPARDAKGSVYLLGPYTSDLQAQYKADEIDNPGEPFELKTWDLAKATQKYKEKRIKKVGLDKAVKRVKHKL